MVKLSNVKGNIYETLWSNKIFTMRKELQIQLIKVLNGSNKKESKQAQAEKTTLIEETDKH